MGARREASRPNPPLRDDAQVMFRINSVSWVRSQDTHRKALQGKPDGMGAASCHVPSGLTRSEAPGRRTARPSFASNRMGVVARISQDAPRDPAAAAAEPPDQGAHNEPRTPRQPPTPGPASGQHPAPSTQHPAPTIAPAAPVCDESPTFRTSRPRSPHTPTLCCLITSETPRCHDFWDSPAGHGRCRPWVCRNLATAANGNDHASRFGPCGSGAPPSWARAGHTPALCLAESRLLSVLDRGLDDGTQVATRGDVTATRIETPILHATG